MSNKTVPRETVTETVTLAGPHTHAGRPRVAGEPIEVTAVEKAFLIAAGKIAAAPGKDASQGRNGRETKE